MTSSSHLRSSYSVSGTSQEVPNNGVMFVTCCRGVSYAAACLISCLGTEHNSAKKMAKETKTSSKAKVSAYR